MNLNIVEKEESGRGCRRRRGNVGGDKVVVVVVVGIKREEGEEKKRLNLTKTLNKCKALWK